MQKNRLQKYYTRNIFDDRYFIASIVQILIVSVCTMIVILYSLQEHIFSGLLFGLLIVPIVSYLTIRHTDSLLFLGVILNFTPYSRQFGNIIIVGTSLIKLFHFTVVEKKKLPFDFIISMWAIIGILLIITIPKWHFISLGLKTTNSIFVIPILIYLLFSSDCIDYNGVKRFINYYFPILAIYLLVQFVWHYYSNNISLSSDWTVLHTSFDLDWGRNNTIAAVAVLLFSIIFGIYNTALVSKISKIGLMILFSVLLTIPIIIVSRGAILTLILSILIYFTIHLYLSKKIDFKKILLVLSAFVTIAFVFMSKYIYAFIERLVNLKVEYSTLARLSMIYNTLKIIRNNLFIGVGPEQIMYSDTLFATHNNPHNIFLQYASELGILSVIIIVILLISPFYKMFNLYRVDNEKGKYVFHLLFLPMIVAIINSQLEVAITLRSYGIVYWIIFAICIKMSNDLKLNKISLNYLNI